MICHYNYLFLYLHTIHYLFSFVWFRQLYDIFCKAVVILVAICFGISFSIVCWYCIGYYWFNLAIISPNIVPSIYSKTLTCTLSSWSPSTCILTTFPKVCWYNYDALVWRMWWDYTWILWYDIPFIDFKLVS